MGLWKCSWTSSSREKRQIDLIILTNFFAFKMAIDKLEVAFGHMPNLSPKDSYHIRLIINSICNLTNRCPTRCRSSNYLLCQTFNHVFCQLNIDENCKARRNVLIANLIPPKFYMCKQTTSKAAWHKVTIQHKDWHLFHTLQNKKTPN